MFQFENERQDRCFSNYPHSPRSSSADTSRAVSETSRTSTKANRHLHRALPSPPRTVVCSRVHSNKPTVPLKVWVIASASCFAVCAALVLATVVITKWGTDYTAQHYYENNDIPYTMPDPVYSQPQPEDSPFMEKLSLNQGHRKNQSKINNLETKIQIQPITDELSLTVKNIEKKHQAIPAFKPTLPDVYIDNLNLNSNDEYYYDEMNLYNDYLQSNSITNYLIEKIQELHKWVTTDKDFQIISNSTKLGKSANNKFEGILKSLNESLVEGNVTIVLNKLKDLYFGENYTQKYSNNSRRVISNNTDLLSFGLLSLDTMLLHNIQLMAWENLESTRQKMLKDPEVFAFNALFMDPSKIEAKYYEIRQHDSGVLHSKRQNFRQEANNFDIGRNIIENILEIGMSTARAAIHLGRAYKNTKSILNQLSNKNQSVQSQLARNMDSNSFALNHLQTSFNGTKNNKNEFTELDCIWYLYCRNLISTSKLAAPYGVMARINGVALRMLTGELSSETALDTMLYEAFTGWSDLRCMNIFPKCSRANAAHIVLDSILQPLKKANKV